MKKMVRVRVRTGIETVRHCAFHADWHTLSSLFRSVYSIELERNALPSGPLLLAAKAQCEGLTLISLSPNPNPNLSLGPKTQT